MNTNTNNKLSNDLMIMEGQRFFYIGNHNTHDRKIYREGLPNGLVNIINNFVVERCIEIGIELPNLFIIPRALIHEVDDLIDDNVNPEFTRYKYSNKVVRNVNYVVPRDTLNLIGYVPSHYSTFSRELEEELSEYQDFLRLNPDHDKQARKRIQNISLESAKQLLDDSELEHYFKIRTAMELRQYFNSLSLPKKSVKRLKKAFIWQ